MKKISILFLFVLMIITTPVIAGAKDFTLGIEAGYYSPIDNNFTDIYGSGEATFGVNAAYRFLKFISIQTAYNVYNAEGELLIPGFDLNVGLKTLRVGGFFHLDLKKIIPKAGGGFARTWVNGETPFGSIADSRSGWFLGTGLDVRVFKNFLTGFELLYNDVAFTVNNTPVSVGGLSFLVSFKVEI